MSVPQACPTCLRRAWLLELIACNVERIFNPGADLLQLLRLDDERLAEAVAPSYADHLLARVEALPERTLYEDIDAAQAWAICRHDERYPNQLRDLGALPPPLICRGDPGILAGIRRREGVAVVGTRRATSYGRATARSLARDLTAGRLTVVGSIDFGIDGCAQRGALDVGSPVAVLSCGVDLAYPRAHRSLWRRIQERGLLVSEFAPGATPWKWTQAARGRIIAALAEITVVVEAMEHSLAMGAAHAAAALGHDLGAVPGPLTSSASEGTNALLAHGALVIRGAADVAGALADARRRPRHAGRALARQRALRGRAASAPPSAHPGGHRGKESVMAKRRSPRRKPSEEERAEKRAAERELMASAVEQLRSSEGWQRWLAARRHFHRYSLHNQILIAFQRPGATRVAGFRAWLKLGYAVRKGERGISIWAPCPPSKRKLREWKEAGADPDERPRTRFRLVRVFDRAQVAPLPELPGGPVDLDPPCQPVEGEGLAFLFPALREFGASIGSAIRDSWIPGPAKGYYEPATRDIVVEEVGEGFSANAQVATTIHELSHALVRCDRLEEDPRLSYAEEEVVVECVSYTVCASVGLDTAGAAVPYMTGWSTHGGEIELFAALIDRLASRLEDAVLAVDRPESAEEAMALAAV